MADERPAYYRLYADVWVAVSKLPKAKAAKLLYAMVEYFFDGTEPTENELPVAARGMFEVYKAGIANYRRNALNGTRNRQKRDKNESKPRQNRVETDNENASKMDTVLDMVLKGSDEGLPAETQKVGGKHSDKHSDESASNIINHKSLIINTYNQPRVVTGAGSERATAGAAMERPAAALPTRAEYERISRKLETEGLDAITPEEREAYHAGHTAYAAT